MPIPLTITAQTTRNDLLDEYQRCSGYDVDGDTTAARQFVRVCRALLSPRYPSEAEQGGKGGFSSRMVLSTDLLSEQLKAALKWLSANDPNFKPALGGGGVIHASNTNGWER